MNYYFFLVLIGRPCVIHISLWKLSFFCVCFFSIWQVAAFRFVSVTRVGFHETIGNLARRVFVVLIELPVSYDCTRSRHPRVPRRSQMSLGRHSFLKKHTRKNRKQFYKNPEIKIRFSKIFDGSNDLGWFLMIVIDVASKLMADLLSVWFHLCVHVTKLSKPWA